MGATKNNKNNQTDTENKLRTEVQELKDLVAQLLQNQIQEKENKVEKVEVKENYDMSIDSDDLSIIPENKHIKIASLTSNALVLSTEGYGKGKIYEFGEFGQVKSITYNNVANILYNQQSFAENGMFYVLDKDVVRNHELTQVYENILNVGQMRNILDYKETEMKELFNRTTDAQRETIVALIVRDLDKGKNLDLNKLSVLSREYGKDIFTIYQQTKTNK